MFRTILISGLMFLSIGCQSEFIASSSDERASGDTNSQALPGSPRGVLLARLTGEASLEDCPNGGIEIAFGVDENLSGMLEAEEVDGTEIICNGLNGEDGENAVPCATIAEENGNYTIACPGRDPITVRDGDRMLFNLSSAAPSEACPHGAVRLEVGADENQDGVLDPDEVTSSELICAGEQGPQGEPCGIERQGPGVYTVSCPGSAPVTIRNGQSSAVSFEAISPGRKCAHGGVIYQWGADQNNNDILEETEVLVSVALCTPASEAQFCERYRYHCGDWPGYLPSCESVWREGAAGGPGQIVGPVLSCFDYALFQAESTGDIAQREVHCQAARGEQVCIAPESDGDGVANDVDNCPLVSNGDQTDTDGDGLGDVCDLDVDGDGILHDADCDDSNALAGGHPNDLDCDGVPDAQDDDADGDGVPANLDCDDADTRYLDRLDDLDCDGINNYDDADADGDGVRLHLDCDDLDPSQGSFTADLDCDGIPNTVDSDADGDQVEVTDDCDDTRSDRGARRSDLDCDGIPDSSDFDRDGDGISADLDCDDLDASDRRTRRERVDGSNSCDD